MADGRTPRGTRLLAIDSTGAAVIVVIVGLVVIAILGGIAMGRTDGDMAPLAAAAFGVIGSVVGAFFGIHAGASVMRRESEKTQRILVSMMDDEKKKAEMNDVLDRSDSS